MKNSKLSFLLIVMLMPVFANSQMGANLGLGYNVGVHASNKGLNFVLDRYNETRSYLASKMSKPSVYRGMTFFMDFYFPKGIMDFDLTYNKAFSFAEGVDITKSLVHRDIRFNANSLAMGFGKKIISTKNTMGIYCGSDFNMILLKVSTRVYTVGQSIPDFERVQTDINLGLTPFVQWVGNRFSTKAYLRFLLLKNDYYYTNMKINPNTATKDNYQSTKGGLVSLGFAARYNLFPNKKK